MHDAVTALSDSDLSSPRLLSSHLLHVDQADGALARLKAIIEEFLNLAEGTPPSAAELLHATAASLHQFSGAVIACEDAGWSRSSLLPHMARLRTLQSRSPFVERLQSWPRGYAGDFETVEWLCDATNKAPVATIAWAIEECALQSPVAQQHRNKVAIQSRAMLSTVLSRSHARIASIGCGGCRDLSLIQDYVSSVPAQFVLVDADAGALAAARARLPAVVNRCDFVAGRVPRVLSNLGAGGAFDLVVAGGLFDYLPDRWAVATLREMRKLLVPGGKLLFSNIAEGNPFRPWLEYLADWRLIERGQGDLARLLTLAGFPEEDRHFFRDSSSLAFMVAVRTSGSVGLCSDSQEICTHS